MGVWRRALVSLSVLFEGGLPGEWGRQPHATSSLGPLGRRGTAVAQCLWWGGVSTVCPLWWWCDFCCDLWSVPSGWLAVSPGAGPSIRRLGRRSSERGWEEGCYSPSAHRAVDHQCLPAEKTCFVLLLLACCRDKQITRNAYHTVEKCTRQEQ